MEKTSIYLGRKSLLIAGLILIWALLFFSCSEPEPSAPKSFILRTGVLSVSSEDFSEELDLKRAAYPYNIKNQPDEYNEMVIHLVKGLSEEIILLSAARDLGVVVTDQQVDQAEAELRKDYPDDSFDQMLLKNVISYPLWKKRFKKDMIMERLIEQELKQKIEISSQELVDFYNKHGQMKPSASESETKTHTFQDEEMLVSRLRMQKTQASYEKWIQTLWETYPVEINQEELRAFLIDVERKQGE